MIAIEGLGGGYVKRVVIYTVDPRQRFNKIRGVAFVAAKPGSNRMSIDCDTQSENLRSESTNVLGLHIRATSYLVFPATDA